jgi:crotonobetainyl-CoA:carnitine CoA-transferase CaiB-like acyl-CoA transferase
MIGERLRKKSSHHWISLFLEAGVPCGEINSIDQVFADPQVRHLGMAAEMDSIPFGKTHCVAQPMTFSRTPSRIVRRPPARGEHTDEILHEIGYTPEAIEELRSRNIV